MDMAFRWLARKGHRHIELTRMLALHVNDWQQAYGVGRGALAVEKQLAFIISKTLLHDGMCMTVVTLPAEPVDQFTPELCP